MDFSSYLSGSGGGGATGGGGGGGAASSASSSASFGNDVYNINPALPPGSSANPAWLIPLVIGVVASAVVALLFHRK